MSRVQNKCCNLQMFPSIQEVLIAAEYWMTGQCSEALALYHRPIEVRLQKSFYCLIKCGHCNGKCHVQQKAASVHQTLFALYKHTL